MRYHLGVGRRTPIAAMQGDMGWTVSEHLQWLCLTRQWCRLAHMEPSRVFAWAHNIALQGKRTALFHTMCYYTEQQMDHLCDINNELDYYSLKENINSTLHCH